jgi:uncharacterized protein YhbP (UPF0306 family)
MNPVDPKIIEFINEHHVLSLATTAQNQPYIANCFYVFEASINTFYFTSDPKTRHSSEAIANAQAAASIVLETKTVGKIQGLQITGTVNMLHESQSMHAKFLYLKAFPYAILHLETMWSLKVEFYKLTDNRLGFGKKILWSQSNP